MLQPDPRRERLRAITQHHRYATDQFLRQRPLRGGTDAHEPSLLFGPPEAFAHPALASIVVPVTCFGQSTLRRRRQEVPRGARSLELLAHKTRRKGGQLVLMATRPAQRRILEKAGLGPQLAIYVADLAALDRLSATTA